MAHIIEVLGMENHGEWANVEVVLNDGTEANVWIGGDCEVYLDKGKIKAFVKKSSTIKPMNKESQA